MVSGRAICWVGCDVWLWIGRYLRGAQENLCFGLHLWGGRFAELGGVMYNRRKLYAHHKCTGAALAGVFCIWQAGMTRRAAVVRPGPNQR